MHEKRNSKRSVHGHTSSDRFEVLSRRQLFRGSASVASVALTGFFGGLLARPAAAQSFRRGNWWNPLQPRRGSGYGELRPAGPDLLLPRDFEYSVVSEEGDLMDDGYPVPKAMDGMCAFQLPNGNIRLIRNHEDREEPRRLRPRTANSASTNDGILSSMLNTHFGPRAWAYDAYAVGGTTSLEVSPYGQRRLVEQRWSLVGTSTNCAGGRTPWGSWLSAEEAIDTASETGFAMNHGYLFEVPSTLPGGVPATPVPLRQLGRFLHEAAAVDPDTGIVYETEDNNELCGFYRFVPTDGSAVPTAYGELASVTGQLQMLGITGLGQYDTAIDQSVGVELPVTWYPIDDPDPTPTLGPSLSLAAPNPNPGGPPIPSGPFLATSVFNQGWVQGAARFRKAEGVWLDGDKVYFHASQGGNMALGQLWGYDPTPKVGFPNGSLTLLFESPGVDVLDLPDNMSLSPRGGLVVCEDGTSGQFLRGIAADGEVFDFARNIRNSTELAGVCFSPCGRTMFVNIFGRSSVRTIQPGNARAIHVPLAPEQYERACTLAIWGPWERGGL